MLVFLGFAMVIVFMTLIMTKRLTPMVALILVPTIFGLFAGAGLGIGDMVLESLKSLAPTVALLMFAIVYFGLMIDVGLFDPLVRGIQRLAGGDPAKIVVGTAVLAGAVSLDGDGSTTFIITTAAMLPLYLKLGMSPVVLTCVAGLANGTLNIVPWGGPTARAAASLGVSPTDIFVPLVPSLIAGLAIVLGFAWFLGVGERNRLAAAAAFDGNGTRQVATPGAGLFGRGRDTGARGLAGLSSFTPGGAGSRVTSTPTGTVSVLKEIPANLTDTMLDPDRATLRPKLFWVNLGLTVVVLVLLVLDLVPLAYVFMVGSAVALIINFPKLKQQSERIVAHSSSIVAVISMVLAAAVLIGVLNGTGMVDAMAEWLVSVIPSSLGGSLAVITGVLSIPMTFFMSNDAFYFGILPVLTESAAAFGISPVEMARASVIGQPVHLQSPLVPAILLLVSLANVNLGDHHRKVLWRAVVVSLTMLVVGVVTTAIPWSL
ncbi:CitMHS family transporter [Subtercola boreus]|uniref:Citrate:proton symporter n=1 Tax=Subtercola boreus TaxID=120213 RepID=A0A3E0WD48_9MICO|nr:citrate:proton symporter [Subtercola boreus]RFA22724.1 citrate:proton symporter [Subtercola boreus]RFA23079.1 citrate:proton symporter [Subtercola boreus]RFA28832.1 citrate:proton symporter [Subtercola boreus]